jgi:hypothetical protein
MNPGTYNLNIYRGDTDRRQFKLWTDKARTQPADLTGVTVIATIRDKISGGSYVLLPSCAITLPNIIDMVTTSLQSTGLPITGGVWDLQLTYPSGDVTTVLKGVVLLTQDVTNSTVVVTPQLARVR